MFTSTGIVLKSFDYKEKERIITLFAKEEGFLSLIVKKISHKNLHLLALTSPFSEGEFSYVKGSSNLYLFQEGSLLEPNLQLRERLASLQTASGMAKLLLTSQMPGQSAPFLYAQLRAYLKQIPLFEKPASLLASFQLKLLKHEGLIPLDRDPFFSLGQWKIVQELLVARSFKALQEIEVSQDLKTKLAEYIHIVTQNMN